MAVLAPERIEPASDYFKEEFFLKEPTLKTNKSFADCECQYHGLKHTIMGDCDERAEYKMKVDDPTQERLVYAFYLCPECVSWYKEKYSRAFPNMTFIITPLSV